MLRHDAVVRVYYPIYAVQIMYGRNICRKPQKSALNRMLKVAHKKIPVGQIVKRGFMLIIQN